MNTRMKKYGKNLPGFFWISNDSFAQSFMMMTSRLFKNNVLLLLCAWFWVLSFLMSVLRANSIDAETVQPPVLRWEDLEREVIVSPSSSDFVDSLRSVYGIDRYQNLRTIENGTEIFKKREKYVYDGGWGFVRAGFLVFETTTDENANTISFIAKVFTNNFVSAFYKVRDFVTGVGDLGGLYPYFFEEQIHENRYFNKEWTLFDHEHGKIFTSKKKCSVVSPFIQNYVSLIFYLRNLTFSPGDTFSIPCYTHEKEYPIRFRALSVETITVEAGTFECIKVEPKLVGEGKGFTKRDKMYLWLTNDSRKILVMARSQIAVGSISVTLLKYEYDQ